MAKNSIRDYSATSSLNTDVQSVDISEGCAASGINNAIREVMADLKDVSSGTIALETPSADQLNVDNIRIDGNTISSTDTNGDITLDPNGTGDVIVASGNVGIGTSSPAHLVDAIVASGSATARFGTTHNTGANDGTVIISNGGSGDAMLRFDYEGTNTDRARIGVTSSGQQLEFYTAGNNERMRIDSSGNVGIGISSPSFASGNGLHLDDNYFVGFGNGGSGRPDFQIGTVGGSTLDFRCGFGSDTADLTLSTGGVFTGDFVDTSDERLKENIQDIAANQIDVVKQLRPVTFDWKAAEKGTNTGFIAQEVMALLPNDVQRSDPEDENSTLGINSMALVATLTGALQEAIAKIEALETRIEALETA